jgi:hypothetical protein
MAEVNQDAIAAARAAGYSDDEIVSHLAQSDKRFATAKEAGYSGKEIIGHLVGAPSEAPAENLANDLKGVGHGAASMVGGLGETAKLLGATGVGNYLTDKAAKAEPTGYVPASEKLGNGDLTALPRVAAEMAPGLALDLTSMKVGKTIGGAFGAKGKALGALAGYLASHFGQSEGSNVKATAQAQGHDAATTGDILQGTGVTAAQAATGLLGAKALTGAGRVASTGTQGVIDAAAQFGKRALPQGAASVAQNLEGQLGTTAGSEQGMRVDDPKSLIASGLGGAGLGAAFSSPRLARDVAGAVRERNTDTDAATRVTNRAVQRAGSVDALANTKTSGEAYNQVHDDLKGELKQAAAQAALSQDAQNSVNAILGGTKATPRDFANIDSAGDPTLRSLADDVNYSNTLLGRGNGGDKLEGGATAFAKNLIARHPIAAMHAAGYGGIGTLLAGGGSAAAAAAPSTAAGLGALWLAGRSLDHVTGMRSPGLSAAQKFADGGATRVAPALAPQPQPGPTQGAFPGGAPVAPGQGPWGRAPQPATVPNVAQAPAPQPGIAKPPPGFQSLLQTAVMGINKDQRQADRRRRIRGGRQSCRRSRSSGSCRLRTVPSSRRPSTR